MARVGGKEEHKGFWWKDLGEGDHLEDIGEDGEDNIKMNIQEFGWEERRLG